MFGHPEHPGLEISIMPSNEKEEAKISCKCGVCELTLADGKSTVSFLCGCEDCRQALQWGFKNGGIKPDPLPRIYYMRSDIIDVKGRDKMIVVKLREDGRSRRIYCTNCYSILGVDHPGYKNNIFLNFPKHCINRGDLTVPLTAIVQMIDIRRELVLCLSKKYRFFIPFVSLKSVRDGSRSQQSQTPSESQRNQLRASR